MKCIILAAGEGKRMRPLTYTRPKVMLPVANKPLIEYNLVNAISAGFDEFIFVIGYKSEMVRNYFENGKKWNTKIQYINQGKPLGTAHAISTLEKIVDDFVLLSGDTIFGVNDIKSICEENNSIGLFRVENPSEYGSVNIANNQLIKIYEKVSKPPTRLINAGIYHFNEEVFNYIKFTKKSIRGEYEFTDTINLMASDYPLRVIKLSEWFDVVYPWNLLEVNRKILDGIYSQKDSEIEKCAKLKGNVSIGKGTRIFSGAFIEGPVIIGENCKIGPNCYIRPYSSIGDRCHIGNACEVKNSIIMNNTKIPHHNYVGDSVIGQNCNLGSGTKIANLRLDRKDIKVIINGNIIDSKNKKLGSIIGDNVQTGINSIINVGSTIGNNVIIGPGATAFSEIKPYSEIM
jgi:bifunctional UDP-N-acetylglucosamine pyrophosphorylase/glucosamine-1-phosphate N-acetyltransferase